MTYIYIYVYINIGWKAVAAVWIVMKIMSIPLLYSMKPSFALFASILFFQTSLGFLLIGLYLDSGIRG
jgi:hypothetical protein